MRSSRFFSPNKNIIDNGINILPNQTNNNDVKVNDCDLLCIYTNADSLPNKIQELKSYITLSEKVPDIIALTEIKTKNKWQINDAELNIDGYDMYSNNLWKYNRGIIIIISYVKESFSFYQRFALVVHTTGSHFTRSQFVSYQTPPQTTRTPVIVAATQTPVINNTTICI